MVTAFGKFCRKLRIDRGQIMLDMAESLQVSPAFLSAVENGKKISLHSGGIKLSRRISYQKRNHWS